HPERAEGDGDLRRGRSGGGRVRRLAGWARIRHHHHPEQHEHAGCVRGPCLDLDPGVAAVRCRQCHVAGAGALGRGVGRMSVGKRSSAMKRMVSVVTACAAALSLFSEIAAAQTPEKFTFALNWFAVGDHAAYWVALDKGYFAQRGLDVTLENSKGS